MNNSNSRLKSWRNTGVSVPDLGGKYTLPAGSNGDLDRRSLMADTLTCLYSAVGSAQGAPIMKDPARHAVHQLVVANGALAASEADAFLTLVSINLEAPAAIHLRALGETTRRIVLCREYPNLAKELYDSAEPSWRKVASKLPIPGSTFAKSESDMRALESTERFKKAKADVVSRYHLLNDLEWEMWSKRAHGDIYALVEVSQSLVQRGSDIRIAVNAAPPPGIGVNVMLMRGIGFAAAALANVAQEFGVQTNGRAEACVKKYGEMQERDEKTLALKLI